MTGSRDLKRRNVKNSRIAPDITDAKPKKKPKANNYKYVTIACVCFSALIGVVYFRHTMSLKETVKTPLYAPSMLEQDSSSPAKQAERFWGSYRPNTYFGMRTRSPTSPVFGLMWLNQLAGQMPPPIRHWCDQGDKLSKYGWLKHDGVNFGVQEFMERDFNITTEFVKRPGGTHGGDWTARIKAVPSNKDPGRPRLVSLMFYAALDGQGELDPIISKTGTRLNVVRGASEELGNFRLTFPKSKSNSTHKHNYFIGYASRLDVLKETMINGIKVDAWDRARTVPYFILGGRLVPRDAESGPNFMVHQVTAELPFEFEVLYESGSYRSRPDRLEGEVFDNTLNEHISNFDKKFSETFNLESKGYSKDEISFAKAALGNMVGSIGYFYGSSSVQSVYNEEPVRYWNAPLYTGVPSRSFFPRGFLWDEGFHNLLISKWDPEISKDILSHWLNLLNIEGWIPREQILGDEARARVPDEFVVQKNTNANPPTLMLPLQRLINTMLNSDKESDKAFLKAVFPRLKVWFQWYNTTQVGAKPFTYRWRGRDTDSKVELNPKTLTSGLDDYPRASHPTAEEYHIDLRCWIALAAKLITDIAQALGEDHSEYLATYKLLTDNKLLDQLHWSEQKQQYSDYGMHTDKVRLEVPKPPPNLQPGQRPPPRSMDKIRMVLQPPKLGFVNAFGYVSLFPFLLKIVEPTSPKLFKILHDIKNERLLWTDYGLRSLGQMTSMYNRYNTEHDPPYWRGAIWININYLALDALHHYKNVAGPYQQTASEIYTELRENIVKNMYEQYRKSGYIWENYNDKTGEGKGTHPFTGWSALVTLIMAEIYE